MKHLSRLALLLLILGGSVFVLLFLSADPESGITLAELDAPTEGGASAGSGFSFGNALEGGSVYLAAAGVEPIFYSVLGICGIVLALRVVMAVLISAREQRSIAREKSGSRLLEEPERPEVRDEVSDVVVPLIRPKILKAETPPAVVPAETTPARTMRLRDQVPRSTHGPVARMMFAFAGIVAAFGMLATALVYFRLSSALSEHALQRARVTAVNVSDGASPYLVKKNAAGLRELLRKHGNRPELAYIVVEDRAQRIFAHSFPVLPAELSERSIGADGTDSRRTLRLGGNAVYEVSVPIMEGRSGAVRVGIWRERVEKEINETMKPLIAWLACVSAGGILAALFFAWRINRPIFRLVSAAQAISRGDLDTPSPNVGDPGEFGELSRALERLRSSMKAALIRLGR
jgi:HAMP domain-containing protein